MKNEDFGIFLKSALVYLEIITILTILTTCLKNVSRKTKKKMVFLLF